MYRDLASNVGQVLALSPAVQSTSINGAAIDLRGFGSVVLVVNTGAVAGAGDFSAKLQESDQSGSGYTDVAASALSGSLPVLLAADSAYRVGYRGSKRFVRVVLTKNGGTSIAAGAVAIKGNPAIAPVAA